MVNKFVLIPTGEPESDMLAKAAVAVNHIKKMDLPQASKSINEALQLDARNSYLHFFNGFIYHLQARQGDAQKNELAIEGYQQALRIDRSNWIAQEFLGLAYMDLKSFGQAKSQFSQVLLMAPQSTVAMYGLMVSAYMTGDPATACSIADQYSKTSVQPNASFIRSSVIVYASCGEFDKADSMRAALDKLDRNPVEIERVGQRLAQWKSFYRPQERANRPDSLSAASGFVRTSLGNAKIDAAAPERLAMAFKVENDATPSAASAPEAAAPTPTAGAASNEMVADSSANMVLVDVVLVTTQELIGTSKGINLLSALQLQLGSVSSPAYSRNFTSSITNTGETASTPASIAASASTVVTRALTVPALAYSLNIANSNDSRNEVLARPTLAAIEGLPSEFFSGTNLSAGVISASSLGSPSVIPVDKRFGVTLSVTPNFLPNGMIKLKVNAQRTFLSAVADNPKVAYQLEISETTANANVVMKLGDTLVLGGLSEKEAATTRTGVPVLQDIPGVQYFFSNQRKNEFQRSVLILLTPRTPMYTAKSERGQNTITIESMKALREKLGFSGRTPSNIESILTHLKGTDLFREFRQGDVAIERWERMHSTGDRLRQAFEFLYY